MNRRWIALCFIALAQLMVALDATIVSIALPAAQAALHTTDVERQWVITAYAMAFGGLLLLAGRIADIIGRRRAFLLGLLGFSAASALGGAAPDFAVLVAARALQGACAAVLTPTALSLLAVSFTEPKERATAFAVYGSIAGSGAAIGLLLGGALTQFLNWRWCLFVNVPISIIAIVGGRILLPSLPAAPGKRILDAPGAILITGVLVSAVYAFNEAALHGWSSATVLALLLGAGVLLVAFAVRESTSRAPLLPPQIVLNRNRAGADLAVLCAIVGMFGAFLFITYYLQVVRGFSPLLTGVSFLPITVASQLGSWLIARRLMPRVRPRTLMAPGLLVAAAGMALLTQLSTDSAYWTTVLPAELLLGFGISCAMVPAYSTATIGVDQRQAGVAAAVITASQQIGASIGIALLNTVAAGATVSVLAPSGVVTTASRAAALVHGYSVACIWGAAALAMGALVAGVLINAPSPRGAHAAAPSAELSTVR